MTEWELLQLLRSANEAIDSNFQFWLSSSFAVLMAFFFAGNTIVGYVKWTVVSLYLSSTILFSYRLFTSGGVAVRTRRAIEELDSEFISTTSEMSQSFIGPSFMVIIGLGTIATVYFCIFSKKIMGK